MEIIKYYGSDTDCNEFINHNSEPLMAVISHDGSHAIISLLDEGCEHHILLAKILNKYNIDEYFRIIFDDEGADWTFVCPPDYKGINNKEKGFHSFLKTETKLSAISSKMLVMMYPSIFPNGIAVIWIILKIQIIKNILSLIEYN